MNLHKKYRTLLAKNNINTSLRLAHFFAQIDHESGLKPKRESLYFTTTKRLRLIFKTPFRYKPEWFVAQYLRNTEKCANYVYANRMGNGDEASGDGFRYRGGGFIQRTGKNNYELLSKHTGIDYVSHPELLETEADAMICALHYWNSNNLNRYADLDDLDAVSDVINIGRKTSRYGDSNGFLHRKKLLDKYKKFFGAN